MENLKPEERDTILAALRHWQGALQVGEPHDSLLEIATNGASHPLMTPEEIDDLCERLNV